MAHSLGLTQPKPTDHPKVSFLFSLTFWSTQFRWLDFMLWSRSRSPPRRSTWRSGKETYSSSARRRRTRLKTQPQSSRTRSWTSSTLAWVDSWLWSRLKRISPVNRVSQRFLDFPFRVETDRFDQFDRYRKVRFIPGGFSGSWWSCCYNCKGFTI